MAYRKILRLLESTSLVNYQVTEKNQLLNCCEERIYCYLVVFLLLTDKENMKSQCRNPLFFSLNFFKP